MAVITRIRDLNVGGGLAGCSGAVMARRATAGDRAVIEHGPRPGSGRMAIVTGVSRGDVGDRLTRSDAAVMAAETGAEHRDMIHTHNRTPGGGGVTCFTGAAGLNVSGGLAGGSRAIMAR